MPAPLSLDLRQRIAQAATEYTAPRVAARFAVSIRTVHRLRALYRVIGTVAPKAPRGGPPRLVDEHGQRLIAAWLAGNPSLTQAEIAARLTDEAGCAVSRQTAGRTLARMGYTRKKRA